MRDKFRANNFDLIRLFAALQVALHHASEHLGVSEGAWGTWASIVPGVPIFFFLSGFLISRSYETNDRIFEYARNRILRIYPGLIGCTVIAVLSVFAAGYFPKAIPNVTNFVVWIVAQVSFAQFYNPSFMREFGTGVLNGSLWTIAVELQFYLLVPVLYQLLIRRLKSTALMNFLLVGLTLLFLSSNIIIQRLRETEGHTIPFKLLLVSFVPWFYMFLAGVIAQKNFELFYRWFAGRGVVVCVIYLAGAYAAMLYLGAQGGNKIGPVLFTGLACTVFSLAYSAPTWAERLLKHNDISYGVYIYHIPVINLFMFYKLSSSMFSLWLALGITVVMACLSWKYIERPAMKRKIHPSFKVADLKVSKTPA